MSIIFTSYKINIYFFTRNLRTQPVKKNICLLIIDTKLTYKILSIIKKTLILLIIYLLIITLYTINNYADEWNKITNKQLKFFKTHIGIKTKKELYYKKNLDLSKNNISTLPKNIFDNLINLETLWVMNSNISELPNNILDNLTNLKVLNLWNNNISTLPKNIFDNLINLEYLDLDENNISILPNNIFDKLTKLEMLSLKKNNLTCNKKNYKKWGLKIIPVC